MNLGYHLIKATCIPFHAVETMLNYAPTFFFPQTKKVFLVINVIFTLFKTIPMFEFGFYKNLTKYMTIKY